MKKIIVLFALLLSSTVYADPTVFKMEIGKMTEKQLKSIYNVTNAGINKYSNGNMYNISNYDINFEGIQDVTAIFNTKEILSGVTFILPKDKFDEINKTLSEKYKIVNQNIPFVGDKKAKYRDGTTNILIDAPHLSFSMRVTYANDELYNAFNQQIEVEKHNKQQNESSQL